MMKNKINKTFSLETLFVALTIINFINHIIKNIGLPILVILLSIFFFQNLSSKKMDPQKDQTGIEKVFLKTP